MLIEIKNYKNLKDLSYQIDTGKVNFLFGMSGSGKSSILNAICGDNPNDGKTIGLSEKDSVTVNVDGATISPTNTHVFNTDKMNFMISSSDTDPFKEVILVNDAEHERNHAALENMIANLHAAIESEIQIYEQYDQLLTKLKVKKLTKNNKISSSSPFSKMMTKLQSFSKTKVFKELANINTDLLNWRIAGVPLMSNGQCPFCEKTMNKRKINKMQKISQFDAKNFGEIKDSISNNTQLFESVSINTLSELKKIGKQLIANSRAISEFESIGRQFDQAFDLSHDYKTFKALSFSKRFKELFPRTYNEYRNVCRNISVLRRAIKETRKTTDSFLKRKKRIINDIFEKLGIPYLFSVKYVRSGPNEYSIIHKSDSKQEDDKEKLSEGEKALVFLILFLVSSKELNYKLFFIDDPVSSYDTYRRRVIFDLILEYLNGKTVIVLSHDSVFAKFAIQKKKKEIDSVGTVSYLSNNGENSAIVQALSTDCIKSFTTAVRNRCLVVNDQYERAILSRLLLEENYESSLMYTYLSKILHGVAYVKIQRWLSHTAGTDETSMLNSINDELEKLGLPANYLLPLLSNYNQNIDISSYTIFEKAIVLRELANNNPSNYQPFIKSELNNNVHLSEALAIGIDAFLHPIISRTLLDEINSMPSTVTIIESRR